MRVMLYGTEAVVHVRRYVHLLKLAGCDVVLVDRCATRNDPGISYLPYPRRVARLERLLGTKTTNHLHHALLRRLARSVRPDIHHVQWIDSRVWHCAKAGLYPLIATAWGSDLNWMKATDADPVARRVVAEALQCLDLLIVDSPDTAATATELAGRDLNVLLLTIGIDTERFRPGLQAERKRWRDKLKIDEQATVLLSARALGSNYRQNEVIQAFAIWRKHTQNESFLIVRTFGSEETLPALRQTVARLGITDCVRWLGDLPYEDLPGVYAAADLAINFSYIDAFPVTFLECLASGVPIVTNCLSPYAKSDLATFLMFTDQDTVANLARCLADAIRSLPQLSLTALRGRDRVVSHHDEHVAAVRLRAAYETILNKQPVQMWGA
jgi:glycosyltransferase involved in cell wall biosynthesis